MKIKGLEKNLEQRLINYQQTKSSLEKQQEANQKQQEKITKLEVEKVNMSKRIKEFEQKRDNYINKLKGEIG